MYHTTTGDGVVGSACTIGWSLAKLMQSCSDDACKRRSWGGSLA